MSEKAVFPPADFVRRGPPAGVRDIDRRKREKWSRVVVVAPRAEDTPERTKIMSMVRGEYYKILNKLAKHLGSEVAVIDATTQAMSGLFTQRMAHFMGLASAGNIQEYPFDTKSPQQIISDLEKFEQQWQ